MVESDADRIVDRRRLKRQATMWRAVALVAAVAVVAALVGRAELVTGGRHVARLSVGGVIVDDPARDRALKRLAKDDDVAALIVVIDSPGGTVVGGESLYSRLRDVAVKKPVVAVMGEVAASGGYMAALGADRIVARPGTITGSIGVIMQTADVTGLLDKLGIATEAIKSAPLKAVPSPLEKLTAAGREATRVVVEDMYAMFVDMVAERRGLARDKTLELADGRIFTGRQAQAVGLVDELGGEDAARDWLDGKGVSRDLPGRDLKIDRDDGAIADLVGRAISALTGKTYLPERLILDGLVSVWHPERRFH